MPLISKEYIFLKRRQQVKQQAKINTNLVFLPYIPQPILKPVLVKNDQKQLIQIPKDHPIFQQIKDSNIVLKKMRYSLENFLNMLDDNEAMMEEKIMESEFMKGGLNMI